MYFTYHFVFHLVIVDAVVVVIIIIISSSNCYSSSSIGPIWLNSLNLPPKEIIQGPLHCVYKSLVAIT